MYLKDSLWDVIRFFSLCLPFSTIGTVCHQIVNSRGTHLNWRSAEVSLLSYCFVFLLLCGHSLLAKCIVAAYDIFHSISCKTSFGPSIYFLIELNIWKKSLKTKFSLKIWVAWSSASNWILNLPGLAHLEPVLDPKLMFSNFWSDIGLLI